MLYTNTQYSMEKLQLFCHNNTLNTITFLNEIDENKNNQKKEQKQFFIIKYKKILKLKEINVF